jgi:hypothetical protein
MRVSAWLLSRVCMVIVYDTHMHTFAHTPTHALPHIHILTHILTHTYTYSHTHTHTHTHIHTAPGPQASVVSPQATSPSMPTRNRTSHTAHQR